MAFSIVQKWWLPTLIVSYSVFLLFMIVYAIGEHYSPSADLIYWLQILSGNWSPDGVSSITESNRSKILMGALAAVLLNIVSLGTTIGAVVGIFLIESRRKKMQAARVVIERDMLIKIRVLQALKESIEELKKRPEESADPDRSKKIIEDISNAFRRAKKEWEEDYKLTILKDQNAAEKFDKLMKEEV